MSKSTRAIQRSVPQPRRSLIFMVFGVIALLILGYLSLNLSFLAPCDRLKKQATSAQILSTSEKVTSVQEGVCSKNPIENQGDEYNVTVNYKSDKTFVSDLEAINYIKTILSTKDPHYIPRWFGEAPLVAYLSVGNDVVYIKLVKINSLSPLEYTVRYYAP